MASSADASSNSLLQALLDVLTVEQWAVAMSRMVSKYDVPVNESGAGENHRLDKKGTYLRAMDGLRAITTDGADRWLLLMDGANLVQSQEMLRHFPRLNIVVPARYTFDKSRQMKEDLQLVNVHVLNLRFDEVLMYSARVPWVGVVMDYNGTFLGNVAHPTTPQDDLRALLALVDGLSKGCVLSLTISIGRSSDDTDAATLDSIRSTFADCGCRYRRPEPRPYQGARGAHMLFLCGVIEKIV